MSRTPVDPAAARLLAEAWRVAATEFLLGMLDGTIDLNDPQLVHRLEPIFHAYEHDPQVGPLIEQAAHAYSDAALRMAYRYFTMRVCDAAQRGTFDKLRAELGDDPCDDE